MTHILHWVDHLTGLNYWLTGCLAALAFVLLLWRKILERHKYPPGPIPWPLIGNDYSIFSNDRLKYRWEHWAKYGNVVSYVELGRWNVTLLGYDAIHEAFVKHSDNFSERVASVAITSYMESGLIYGERWKDLRKQVIMVLRDHGMGKVAIEEKIRQELEYSVELFSALKGPQNSQEFKDIVGKAVANVICQVVLGHRLPYEDPSFVALLTFESLFLATFKSLALPLYKYWPCDPLDLAGKHDKFKQVTALISQEIRLHKAALDVDNPQDFIDSFLVEGIKTGDPLFGDEGELTATIVQLFLAGFDTTTITLTWALVYLINYPSAQQRLHEEITLAIGNRPVTVADRERLPFTLSFLQEVARCSAVASTSLEHDCLEDTVIQGHTIPKGTIVLANLKSTFQNEQIYEEPELFKADRFLDAEGNFVKPCGKQMLPFSIGRRACPGESLARTELFIIVVSLVQRFEVGRLTDELVSEEGIDVFTCSPKPFQFNIKHRV